MDEKKRYSISKIVCIAMVFSLICGITIGFLLSGLLKPNLDARREFDADADIVVRTCGEIRQIVDPEYYEYIEAYMIYCDGRPDDAPYSFLDKRIYNWVKYYADEMEGGNL